MIETIKIKNEYKTIPENFPLELGRMTVITGENNSGKTNFIKIVAGEAKINRKIIEAEFLDKNNKILTPEIVYIAAENIQPKEDETKFSLKTTGLIRNLSKLFSNLERKFKLEKQNEIIGDIKNLIEKANNNLENFNGKREHALEIIFNEEELDFSIIIQALIKDISGLENETKRGLDDLGQGTQRIIVASILKAYVDILIEKSIHIENPVLILFEEPEIYLHPKLKRSLNATLEKIANQKNHQILITTHDPYFAFKNFGEEEKRIFSFKKENDITIKSEEGIINGIEDELLFIFLYSLLEKKDKNLLKIDIEGFEKRRYLKDEKGDKKEENPSDLTYIRHQIHHIGENPYTVGLVSEKTRDCKDKNYYTEEELSNAIKEICKRINE
jgi:predicted ATPase